MRHVAEREAFRGRLADLGMIQQLIADNEIDLAATRALLMQACWELDEGGRAATSTSIAKTFAAEAMGRVVGPGDADVRRTRGLATSCRVARIAREVRPFRIYDGPSEVHRWSIARRAVRNAIAGRDGTDDRARSRPAGAGPRRFRPVMASRRPTERTAHRDTDRRRPVQPHLPPRRRRQPRGCCAPRPGRGARRRRTTSRREFRVNQALCGVTDVPVARPVAAVRGRRRPRRPVLRRRATSRADDPVSRRTSTRSMRRRSTRRRADSSRPSPRCTGSTTARSGSSASADPTATPRGSSGDGRGSGS